MSNLVSYLADYIKRELVAAINSSPNDSLRVVFSAPPRNVITELFEYLTSENNCMVLETSQNELYIPVYLVDQNAVDPYESSMAARCTPNYLVAIRNYNYPVWLALQEVGASTNASLSTAVKPLGILKEITQFDSWLLAPVIKYLVEQYCSTLGLSDIKDDVNSALTYALSEAWSVDERFKDKRTVWQLLEKLLGVSVESGAAHENLAASLGLPCCSKAELGSKNHFKVLERVSDLFQSLGLRGGFDELENNANDKLLPHVREMRAHIEKQGIIEANEFVVNALKIYSPISENVTTIPEWWNALSIEAWSLLLDAGSELDPVNDVIQVKLSNPLVAVPKGLTPLVVDCVELEIFNADLTVSVEIIVESANGNKALTEIHREVVEPNATIIFTDAAIPEHDRFVRYKISADGHLPVIMKAIVLDFYGPGIVALNAGSPKATPFKINTKARDTQNKKIKRYDCDLHLSGMGSHILDLYTSKKARLNSVIKGYEVDAEHTEAIERTVTSISDNHYSCLIDTDEECHYEVLAHSPGMAEELPYRIYITADENKQTGATSEFDRLVMMHRASATGTHSSPRVDPLNCRLMELETWALESGNSYRPIVIGPDYLEFWRKPAWEQAPTFSGLAMLVDPRPSVDEFKAPTEFLLARAKIFAQLGTPPEEASPTACSLKLYESMRDENFVSLVQNFLNAYLEWLKSDYDNAAWSDVISVHACQSNSKALESTPYVIMLTPYHPIKLAWQCCAQDVLQEALDKHARCPAASVMSPTSFPDCFVLPCRTATGNIVRKSFVAMSSSSDYWGVMLSVESSDMHELTGSNSIFGDELGIDVDGLASGFSAQQVVRSLEEVSRLMSAKSNLRIGVSSDTGGSGSCNEGIDSWCSANLGSEEDDWQDAGPKSIVVIDQRDPKLHPEQAVLASLTSRTDAAVRWFTRQGAAQNKQQNDLSIIAHLSTISRSFDVQGIRSAVDSSALTRWRVRKQLSFQNSALIAESRIGEMTSNVDHDSITGKLLYCVDEVERQCRDSFDSYIFAPDMAKLGEVVDGSRYTALSSTDIDAACFFGSTDKAYLWDYELPSYARRAGENSGYYLLAKESPGMLQAVRSALDLLGDNEKLTDERISSLLEEISRRGMPTLKRLTTGGSMSLGEIGMLTALRIFQSEFERDAVASGLLPVKDNETLNIIISADPFQKHFDDLRTAIEFKHGERPDLLVISMQFVSGMPTQMRLTPVEVKARGGTMSPNERADALSQASYFAELLQEIQNRATNIELWGIAWRNLIATLLDYGFRVYGQLDQFMNQKEWAEQHSAILRSIADNELEIDIDTRGRLIVIDSSDNASQQDIDKDGFSETIRLSHAEAFSVLARSDGEFSQTINSKLDDWQLKPILSSVATTQATEVLAVKDESKDENATSVTPKEKTIEEKQNAEIVDEVEIPIEETEVAVAPEKNEKLLPSGIKFSVGHTVNQFTSEELEFFPGNTALNQLNVGIVGDLGTGKTQLIQALVRQLAAKPEMNRGQRPNILIFDYKKDYSKSNFVEATGARVIKPFDIPLNLFDIRDSAQNNRAWLERTKFFIDVLDKIYPGIGPVQRQRIKSAVKDAYEKTNIAGRVAPTINDVFDSYKEAGGSPDTPYNIMDDLVDGGYFVEDSSEVIPFSEFLNGVVVLDLAEVGQDDRTKNMLVVIFLNLFYEHMLRIEKKSFLGKDPSLRFIDTMLLVDEADNIMKYEFDILKKILLQGREFGVGVLLASQYLSHFKTSHENYLEPLLSWFVHKVPNVTVKELEGIGLIGVNSDMVDKIKSLECHECLYKTLGVDGKVIRATPFFELMGNE
jgi:DNA phosphorothioation-dependent restriction protein DptH